MKWLMAGNLKRFPAFYLGFFDSFWGFSTLFQPNLLSGVKDVHHISSTQPASPFGRMSCLPGGRVREDAPPFNKP